MTIMKMTEEIEIKCNLLDRMIEQYLAARKRLDGTHRRYEAHSEALNLFNLVIRNVEGVIKLARADLVLLPPALAAARAAFEGSVRAAWLINADDPFERETRWLAHYRLEESYLSLAIRERESLGADASDSHARLQSLKEFSGEVAKLLAARGYVTDSKIPKLPQLLRSLGEERTYILYRLMSQTAHATHASTWLYRSGGVGTQKIEGEFVSPDAWNLPLDICRFVFRTPAIIVLTRLGADTAELLKAVG
jgi:hypothetical protein